jgi:hypothetical protein
MERCELGGTLSNQGVTQPKTGDHDDLAVFYLAASARVGRRRYSSPHPLDKCCANSYEVRAPGNVGVVAGCVVEKVLGCENRGPKKSWVTRG